MQTYSYFGGSKTPMLTFERFQGLNANLQAIQHVHQQRNHNLRPIGAFTLYAKQVEKMRGTLGIVERCPPLCSIMEVTTTRYENTWLPKVAFVLAHKVSGRRRSLGKEVTPTIPSRVQTALNQASAKTTFLWILQVCGGEIVGCLGK